MDYIKYEPSVIGKNVKIGEGTVISSFVYIGDRTTIGKNCKIKPFCFIAEDTIIGNNCFLAPGVKIYNDKKPPSKGKHWAIVVIGNNVSIGGGSLIAPGVWIADNSKIRIGSVVTRDVLGDYYRGEILENWSNRYWPLRKKPPKNIKRIGTRS